MVDASQGNSPIVLGLPHSTTTVPPEVHARLTKSGLRFAQREWHIHRLYADLGLDLTRVFAPVHRAVMDVDCAPQGSGQRWLDAGALCPFTDPGGTPMYRAGQAPDAAEVARRVKAYHAPYHSALSTELQRIRDKHGVAILYNCHVDWPVIPSDPVETLTDIKIAADSSTVCAPVVARTVHTRCRAAFEYSCDLDAQMTGGWSISHHGQPADNIHAIEVTLVPETYMDTQPPWRFRPDKAERLRPLLYRILSDLIDLVHERQLR